MTEPNNWPLFLRDPEPKDWPEDSVSDPDNGCYMNKCMDCDEEFIGHKRRPQCKVCYQKDKAKWDALPPEKQEEIIKVTLALADFIVPGVPIQFKRPFSE